MNERQFFFAKDNVRVAKCEVKTQTEAATRRSSLAQPVVDTGVRAPEQVRSGEEPPETEEAAGGSEAEEAGETEP